MSAQKKRPKRQAIAPKGRGHGQQTRKINMEVVKGNQASAHVPVGSPAELQKAHADIWRQNARGEITIRQAKDAYQRAEQEFYARHPEARTPPQRKFPAAPKSDQSPFYRPNPDEFFEDVQGATTLAAAHGSPKSRDKSRQELGALASYLRHYAECARAPAERRRLQWAVSAIRGFLNGDAPTLEHAFGLVAKQGNPNGVTRWAERAALAERDGLSVTQVADRYGLADTKSVREGLRRGREANERARHAKLIEEGVRVITADFKTKGGN